MRGNVSVMFERVIGTQRVMQHDVDCDLLPTKEFLQLLKTRESRSEYEEILVTWIVRPEMNFTLKFQKEHLISNVHTGVAAVKTEYAKLFAFYSGCGSEVLLDNTKAEFLVFRKHLNKLPAGLYRAATEVLEPFTVTAPVLY